MVSAILPLKVENAVVRRRGKTLVGPINATVSAEVHRDMPDFCNRSIVRLL